MAIGFGYGTEIIKARNANKHRLKHDEGFKEMGNITIKKSLAVKFPLNNQISKEKFLELHLSFQAEKRRKTRKTVLFIGIIATSIFCLLLYLAGS